MEAAPIPSRQKRSVMEALATRFSMEWAALQQTLIATIFPTGRAASKEQVAAFCVVAHQYELNPFTKEIYAFPDKGGGIVPIVSVDGWYKIINSHPAFDGLDVETALDDEGKPVSCTAIIYRKDRSHPIRITEYLSECRRNTDPWKNQPNRMLRHRAIVQCARVAFGFGGVYEEDEGRAVAAAEPAEYEVREVRPVVKARIDLKEKLAEKAERDAARRADSSSAPPEPEEPVEVEAEIVAEDKKHKPRSLTRAQADKFAQAYDKGLIEHGTLQLHLFKAYGVSNGYEGLTQAQATEVLGLVQAGQFAPPPRPTLRAKAPVEDDPFEPPPEELFDAH